MRLKMRPTVVINSVTEIVVELRRIILVSLCAQFDALIERLTGRELLTMFARLRGIPEQYIKEEVDMEIKRLDLEKHANKRCGTYR